MGQSKSRVPNLTNGAIKTKVLINRATILSTTKINNGEIMDSINSQNGLIQTISKFLQLLSIQVAKNVTVLE